MGRLFPAAYVFVDGTEANPVISGSLLFSESGNNTAKAVYSDAALTVSLGSTINLDSEGRMPSDAFGSGTFRVRCYSAPNGTGTLHWTKDDIDALAASSIGALLYPRTAAEVSASVMPSDYTYPPGDVRRYGAVSAAADVTAAFASAAVLADDHGMYIPAGVWNISSVTLGDNANVRTEGFATQINQLAGYDGSPNAQTALVKVAGSNVTVGSFRSTGQIATDSGEFQHVCYVYKTGASIDNVTIGDIYGQDIRGDVLYIGAPSGFTTSNVKAGRITGNNVLRNVVAVVGGVACKIEAAIADGAVGYAVFDAEPDADPSTDIVIDLVKGRVCQIAPPLAADYADRVRIGVLDLDPAYSANSTPTYSAHESTLGLSLRNVRMVQIGNARIKNFTHHAIFHIFNIGELADQRLHIGHLDVSGCGSGDAVYNSPVVVPNMTYVRIDSVVVALQAVGDYAFYGDPSIVKTKFDIGHLVVDGTVVRFARDSTFRRVTINSVNAVNAFRDMTNCVVEDSTITLPSLMNNGTNVTFRNVAATCSSAYLSGTTDNVQFANCSAGLEAVSSPAQITGNQNDYAVGQMVQVLRLSTDASRNVTGITNGFKGRVMEAFNVGSFDLVLTNEDAASAAANRLALGASLTIGPGEGATLWYDSTSSRWRCASRV